MPGGGEGDFELAGEPCSEEAELAGAGDVDDVGTEAGELALDADDVADEERVEGEIFFNADRGEAAGELERLGVAGLIGWRGGWAGADAEEGELMALGVGGEVAAGVSYSVDFVEGVGEVGYARRHGTTVLERDLTVAPDRPCCILFIFLSTGVNNWSPAAAQ